MSTPLKWKQRGRVSPSSSRQPETPFRTFALNLSEAARSALSEPFRLTVEHQPIHLLRLPQAFNGFRIVQLSDVHHSPFTSVRQIERAVETANSLQPDMIAVDRRLRFQGTPVRGALRRTAGRVKSSPRCVCSAGQSRSLDGRGFDY